MSRKFLDTIRSEIDAGVFTNSDGLVTAASVNSILKDMTDSLAQDEAALLGSDPVTMALTGDWSVISNATVVGGAAYPNFIGGDANFLQIDNVAGTITGSTTPGFSYECVGAVSLDAGTNAVIEATIGTNGLPSTYVASMVGTGGVRNLSVYLSRYNLTSAASDAYSLMLRVESGSGAVTVSSRTFGAIVLPTNAP